MSAVAGRRVWALLVALLILGGAVWFARPSAAAAASGQISGMVKFEGTPPVPRTINMGSEPSCAVLHKDKPVTSENVVVGANGGLANVVIYISQGLTGNETAPSQPVQIDQKGCQYIPHVVAVDVGQPMKILNSDHALHNVHPQASNNQEWNKAQMPGTGPIEITWSHEEIGIPLKCSVHPWMRAYVAVVKGPYAVTGESGSFKLDNLPAGVYTLSAWQESYGTLSQSVTVAAGKSATANFTFKAK